MKKIIKYVKYFLILPVLLCWVYMLNISLKLISAQSDTQLFIGVTMIGILIGTSVMFIINLLKKRKK